jgi:hypothetical protein
MFPLQEKYFLLYFYLKDSDSRIKNGFAIKMNSHERNCSPGANPTNLSNNNALNSIAGFTIKMFSSTLKTL